MGSNDDEEWFYPDEWGYRLQYYRYTGWSAVALNDPDYRIRREAYRVLGYTEKAFDDASHIVRLEAYRVLGFTKSSLNDNNPSNRTEAEAYFKLRGEYSKDEVKEAMQIWQLRKM